MRLILYFARTYPWHSLVVLLCLILAAVAEGVGLATMLPLLSLATGGEPDPETSSLELRARALLEGAGIELSIWPMVLTVGIAFWGKAVLVLLAKRRVGYTVAHVATDLRLGLIRSLLAARWGYYTRQPLGGFANAMATEAERSSLAYHYLGQVVSYGVEATLYTGLAFAVSWRVTLGAAVAGLLTVTLLSALVRMAGRAGTKQTRLLKALLGRITDALHAVKLLKATGREPLIGPLLERDTLKLNRQLQRRVLSKEALRALQEPVGATWALLGLGVALTHWSMPFSSVAMLVFLFMRTLGSVNMAQRKYQDAAVEASALWSIRSMIERAEHEREALPGRATPTLEHGIALKGVCVRYDGEDVLRDVSLEIPAGQVTALIGPSGTGKTTIADLITGLVRPDEGEVWVDGIPLEELDLTRWRHMIGYVPQEMLLFHDSVEMNVGLGDPDLDREQIVQALRDAGAWEFVARLPEGLETSVGERGSLFSGGQRQRLSIARALAHGGQLLILDEATAALDGRSEKDVLATVARLKGKATVLAISHQPALVEVADRVYRIEDATAVPAPRGER